MITILRLAELAENVYNDNAIGVADWRRSNRMPPTKENSGFFGAAYFNEAGRACVIAFRGSEFSDFMNDWVETDGRIGLGQMPINQVADAFSYAGRVKRFAASLGFRQLYVTGHSLGGGLAALIGANLGDSIAATFNAPGMGALTSPVNFPMRNPNVLNFRASDDPVSRVGRHIGRPQVDIPVTSRIVAALSSLNTAARLAHAGYSHTIGPLIAALRLNSVGSQQPESMLPSA
jgi:pimeloyl-ACP methyl ester carboxylesterase